MLKTIDLFAGAGGLSYGFEATRRFQMVAAAENNPNARKTYKRNHCKKDIVMIEDVRGCNFRALADQLNG
nr:DNA cytosine methyltransferase [Lachnospiraceae bacterium]